MAADISVSIVVPVFNTEKYLPACLESVLSQPIADMEVIVVNDCSPDGALSVAKHFAERDSRVRIIDLVENGGLGPARNIGLHAAKGTWVGFLDSDDLMEPNALPQLIATGADNGSDIVTGQIRRQVDSIDGSFTIKPHWSSLRQDFSRINTSLDDCQALIHIPGCWSIVYRRSFLMESGIRFRRKFQEDHDFVLNVFLEADRISVRGDIAYIRYRQRAEQESAGTASISSQSWAPDRFAMMADHMATVAMLFADPRYRQKHPTIDMLKKKRMSYYLGRCANALLPKIISQDDYSAFAPSLESIARTMRESDLQDKGIDFDVEPFANYKRLTMTGFYELALSLILHHQWQLLHSLTSRKILNAGELRAGYRGGEIPADLVVAQKHFAERLALHPAKPVTPKK